MSVAPFVESPPDVVRRMLEVSGLKEGENHYDLGCGDGRIVVMAAREFQATSTGIEIRQDLAQKAMEEVKRQNLVGKAEILNRDFFEIDISRADVVTLYLTGSANLKLRPKFEKELKPSARIVSHDFEISGWVPIRVLRNDPPGHTIYSYVVGSKSGSSQSAVQSF